MILIIKEGKLITKSNTSCENIASDLELISKFSRRTLDESEVYIFSLILCDNEIDRDGERFTVSALAKLSELFVGKSGIFDHNPKTANQTARIFKTWTETDDSKATKSGEVYTSLHAKAYMVKTEKNRDLILEIEAGIKKEVSVGIAVKSKTCSVCGADLKTERCTHKQGKSYGGVYCCGILDEPTDAYEWSFVAVPAQKNAGVTKSLKTDLNEGFNMDILKSLSTEENEITFKGEELSLLKSHIKQLELLAESGKEYVADLKNKLIKQAFLSGCKIDSEVLSSVADKMSIDELKQFSAEFAKKAEQPKPMLGKASQQAETNNKNFLI